VDAPNPLKLRNVDRDSCRVYYTWVSPAEVNRLFCFQEDSSGGFDFLLCSRDGEPNCPVERRGRSVDRLPEDDSTTSHKFRTWYPSWAR
jgi:hypothetical protein